MSLSLPIIPTSLPQGFCPSTYQEMWNQFASHGSVLIPAGSLGGVQVSASVPSDQDRPWLQLDTGGNPVRLYWFAMGSWLSLHPLPTGATIWWFDTIPNFDTFDGGSAGVISTVTGPMWQKAKNSDGVEIAAMFPIAAGTLPSTTVLAQGDTGGEENHILTAPEANHYHGFGDGNNTGVDGRFCIRAWSTPNPVGTNMHNLDTTNPASTTPAQSNGILGTSDSLPSDVASVGHNTMPPYVVGYLLQRTDRQFYSVT